MITTNSFPNNATSAPDSVGIKRNSLTEEDLEGGVKKNTTSSSQNINGGSCQNIEI